MIEKSTIIEVLEAALSQSADFAEIFIEDRYDTGINLLSSKVQEIKNKHSYGAGIRVAKGYNRVYGYTNKLDRDSLLKLANDLAKSFPGERVIQKVTLKPIQIGDKHQAKIDPQSVSLEKKTALLYEADKAARSYDKSIEQVQCNYLDYNQYIWVANSNGTYVKDRRTRTRIAITAIASDGKSKQTGFNGPGGSCGFEFYTDVINVKEAAIEAARVAVTMLHADECPSGKMPVVIDNGFGGVIFHEAVGHSLEATSVAIKASVFTGKKGEIIANPLISAVDDGTIPNAWGSASFDDEGNPQTRRQLIKDGVLTSYMIDMLNALRMNDQCTNSGRRESYRFAPTSRMTNTYIENGDSTFDEIIKATKFGLYAKKMGGGSVNPATGDFNFAVSEAYIIRDGKIAEPVKGASLVGTGKEALLKVDMVGNNLRREQGMCGSESGSIPTDVGQPTIRISEITVGGRGGALK